MTSFHPLLATGGAAVGGNLHLSIETVVIATGFCLLATAFFSGTETGLMSVSRLRLREELRGPRAASAKLLQRLLTRVEDPILTCLIGTNLFNVLASSLVTTAMIAHFGPRGDIMAAVVMSVLVIVLGEILPKVLYREFAEPLTLRSARPLRVVMILLSPLRAFLLLYSRLLQSMLPGKGKREGEGPGREGLASLLRAHAGGEGAQLFDELLGQCLQLSDLNLSSLMTRLDRVVTLPRTASYLECCEAAAVSGYSRLPVHDDDPGNPSGWILVRDLLFATPWDEPERIPENLLRTCPLVEHTMSPWALFEEMRWQRQQMAIVADETGTPIGLVTFEDLLEMLVGSIEDEFDRGWRRATPHLGG